MTTTQDPKAGQQGTSQRVTVGAALASVVPDGLPFRLTAYDGSSAGPDDAAIRLHLATPRGLSYLLTAPGDACSRSWPMRALIMSYGSPGCTPSTTRSPAT